MNQWKTIMEFILEQAEEFEIHIWYSMELEWCFISFRGFRWKITSDCTIDEIRELIENIKHDRIISARELHHIEIV
jgi:hypothetical protein